MHEPVLYHFVCVCGIKIPCIAPDISSVIIVADSDQWCQCKLNYALCSVFMSDKRTGAVRRVLTALTTARILSFDPAVIFWRFAVASPWRCYTCTAESGLMSRSSWQWPTDQVSPSARLCLAIDLSLAASGHVSESQTDNEGNWRTERERELGLMQHVAHSDRHSSQPLLITLGWSWSVGALVPALMLLVKERPGLSERLLGCGARRSEGTLSRAADGPGELGTCSS